MQSSMLDANLVAVVASDSLEVIDIEPWARNAPSLYADPVAWLTVEVVGRVLNAVPGGLSGVAENVAVLAVSEDCTVATMQQVASRARRGRVSPLHFAGANPGSMAGLVCMERNFRGPTMTLTMPPDAADEAVTALTRYWLLTGQAQNVLVATHQRAGAAHLLRCTLWGSVASGPFLRELP